ncbi:M24 family metallopeptidase [Aureimonas altamirensis]|uniref:M24 family metallopeptidase n=1 Tax=Aureimonas altamirensis TaxID=370622 RepID=UPI00255431E6|nr:Xaa-Pro peptidase family protein [Aureimonas altamirensis]
MSRADRIRERMKREGLDAMLVTAPTNVWYVTGFWEFIPIRMESVLVPADGACCFMVSKNEHEYAEKTSWIDDVRYYTEFPEDGHHQNPYDLLKDVVLEKGLGRSRIGIDEASLPLGEFRRLEALLPNAKFSDSAGILSDLRMVKSPYELDLLKKSGKVAVAGWNASLHASKAGMREYEVAQCARVAATEMAANLFDPEDVNHSPLTDGVQLIQAGKRSSISHGRGSPNRLRQGDMVAMCFCMTNQFKGYRVGFSRNFVIGTATDEMYAVYDLIYRDRDPSAKTINETYFAAIKAI